MIEIDWNQLKKNSDSKEISFEKFCFQVAVAKFRDYGKFTYPYNMSGSEFYLELTQPLVYEGLSFPIGSVICWQAKFWVNQNDLENTSLTKTRRKELVDGFKDTFISHPKMALWIVCTPGMVKEKAYDDLKSELAVINPNIEITHWHKSVFESIFLEDESKYKGITAFFFGKYNINNETLTRLSRATIDALKQKYDVELHTETSFERQLMSMVDAKTANIVLKERLHALAERLEHYEKQWTSEAKKARRSEVFPENVLVAFEEYESYLLTLGKQLCAIDLEDGFDAMVFKGEKILQESFKGFEEVADKLTNVTDAEEEFVDSYLFQNYAEDIIIIKDIIYSGKERRARSVEYAIDLRVNDYFPVFAQAGYGKTHFACAVANKLLNEGLPALLLTGNRFKHYTRPQEALIKLFEVEGKLTFDELLGALDSLVACYPGAKMPIIIDGLNESFPSDTMWKEELPLMLSAIKNTEHLFLVTTCREKTEYIQRIYGLFNYNDVENNILLEGIEDRNLAETIRKYYTKYSITNAHIVNKQPFKNPLLLKIFCEAKKGTNGLVVNDYSLAECMKDYSNQLVDNIARIEGVIDKSVKHDLKNGLLAMGRLLWERNVRTLNYWGDFRTIFNEKTEDLLEEGVCFQIDLKQDESEVKFTYDLMAGYHIADYLLSSSKDTLELEKLLHTPVVYNKLFGNSEELHTLSEDIIKSLVYLVAERDGKDLFDLVPEDAALSKILGNLDFICGSERGRKSLEKRLEIPLGTDLKKSICELVKEKAQKVQSVFGLSSLLPAFMQMNTEEFDMLFHSIFLDYGAMEEVVQCIKKHLKEDGIAKDALAAAFLFSGSFVREKRQELIRQITFYAENHFAQYLPIAASALTMSDPFIRETVYLSAVGAAVRCGRDYEVKQAIALLSEDLRENPTTHIVLLDLLESLMEYAKVHNSLTVDKSVLFLAKNAKWPKKKENWHSVYEYDFEKFHLRPYSMLSHKNRSPYTSDDLWYMIVKRMKDKGFHDDVYSQREKELSDNRRYWQSTVSKMAYKQRDTAQRELVGWLLLNGIIDPEYKYTLRTDEIDIDPSYPAFSPLKNLDTKSYLCRYNEDTTSWLMADPICHFEKKLCTSLTWSKRKWVLLRGYITQQNEGHKMGSRFYWSVKTSLNWDEFNSHDVQDLVSSPSHLFAFEIGWREMKPTEEDYFDQGLGMPLLNKYEFSAWDNERDKLPSFYFINEAICKEFNLQFSLKDLCYYKGEERIVEVFQCSASLFYYIRQDILEKILDHYNVHLDFIMYAEKFDLKKENGDNSYKSYKKLLSYNDIKDVELDETM